MKFIHSLSTRPMRINCYGIDGMRRMLSQIWYFSLSVAYLKSAGAEVVLHTDSLGKAMLGHLPYDEIHLTLDRMPADIHPRFWAAGKFIALKAENGRCMHIDGDVFIKRKSLVDKISSAIEENDIVLQGRDSAKMYALEIPLFKKEKEFSEAHGCYPDGADAYNTGIIGVKDDTIREAIIENYMTITKYFSKRHREELDKQTVLTPDLLAEQKMIEGLSREKQWRVHLLLEGGKNATQLGYQHVFSIDKFNALPSCKATLAKVSPEIYASTLRLCGE